MTRSPPSTSPCCVRFADLAVEGLGAAREEIDALNVYPVPDGDTGTNMYLTFEGARDQRPSGSPAPETETGDLAAGPRGVLPAAPCSAPAATPG